MSNHVLTHYAQDELSLLAGLVGSLRVLDPDVLLGWEVQKGSMGYLLERWVAAWTRALEVTFCVCCHALRMACSLSHPQPACLPMPWSDEHLGTDGCRGAVLGVNPLRALSRAPGPKVRQAPRGEGLLQL